MGSSFMPNNMSWIGPMVEEKKHPNVCDQTYSTDWYMGSAPGWGSGLGRQIAGAAGVTGMQNPQCKMKPDEWKKHMQNLSDPDQKNQKPNNGAPQKGGPGKDGGERRGGKGGGLLGLGLGLLNKGKGLKGRGKGLRGLPIRKGGIRRSKGPKGGLENHHPIFRKGIRHTHAHSSNSKGRGGLRPSKSKTSTKRGRQSSARVKKIYMKAHQSHKSHKKSRTRKTHAGKTHEGHKTRKSSHKSTQEGRHTPSHQSRHKSFQMSEHRHERGSKEPSQLRKTGHVHRAKNGLVMED